MKYLKHKKVFIAAAVLLIAVSFISLFVYGCAKQKEKTTSVKFENPQYSVSTDWLSKHLEDENLTIIDVRKNEEYEIGHIPGAVNIPIDETVDGTKEIPGMVGSEEQIERLLSESGISNSSKIVIYDNSTDFMGGRMFWVLHYYGHENLALLDGGYQKWKEEDGRVTKKIPEYEETSYNATPHPERVATTEQVRKWLENENSEVVFVDTRTLKEWVVGHLPGAVRLNWTVLFTDDKNPVLKSPAELLEIFEENGITKDKQIVLY